MLKKLSVTLIASAVTLIGMLLVTVLALCGRSALAQDNPRAMLVGTWEGSGANGPARLQFLDDSGKWRYSFRVDRISGEAEGGITSFSPPTLELDGVFTQHTVAGRVGMGVKFTLNVIGDQMTGTGKAAAGNPAQISLTKKK